MFSDAEISVFMDELEEKIQILNDNFLLLEREGENQQVLQEIFRAAHTVKGSSAIMGYDGMSRLTHEMENLFDRLRQGRLKISGEMIDVLLEALDALKSLRDEITGQGKPADIEQVIKKIQRLLVDDEIVKDENKGTADSTPVLDSGTLPVDGDVLELTEAEEEVIRAASTRGFNAYSVYVTVEPRCQMKFVRAFLIFRTLQEHGEIIKSVPPAEEIQEGEYDTTLELVLLSREGADRIKQLVLTISEVIDAVVDPIMLAAASPQDGAPGEIPHEAQDGREEFKKQSISVTNRVEETHKQVKTVRIDVQKLDSLMNLVGELVIDRTRLDRFAEVFENRYDSSDLTEVLKDISNHLGQLTNDLQEQILKARMLPIAQVINRFPRMVRDLAHKLDKEIDFIVEGKETELDRNVLEIIGDPLIHLLRNAVDHGIEPPQDRVAAGKPRTGTIRLKAFHQEGNIIIIVEDDGRGIDVKRIRDKAVERGLVNPEAAERLSNQEVLNFIFLPGFSMARQVTDLSGRGVGMDVVRGQIEQINGQVELSTVLGQGTKFTIKLPLTLAIIRALMVSVSEQIYAFPLANVMETIYVSKDEVRRIGDSEVTVVRGQVLPLVSLARILGLPEVDTARMFVVIVGSGSQRLGVVVTSLLGEREIVIKSLGCYLGQIPCVSGATILGDGKVALIVDVRSLIQEITQGGAITEAAYAAC
ncbi:MAG: chemotaxis protein CheA [Bacillota bacterium]